MDQNFGGSDTGGVRGGDEYGKYGDDDGDGVTFPPTTHPAHPAPRGGHRRARAWEGLVVLPILERFPHPIHQAAGLGLVPCRPDHALAAAHGQPPNRPSPIRPADDLASPVDDGPARLGRRNVPRAHAHFIP